jgi:tRNA nucleotidyltransferase (CCA-adding enzyme)
MDFVPSDSEKEKVEETGREIAEEVKELVSKYDPEVKLVGSTAKGTFVSGDTDIDVYVISEEYEDAFSKAKKEFESGHRKRGELTIWNFDHEGYDVDLVFIPPDYEKVDTLKHTEFFDERLSEEEKNEVVKGKALFKSEGVYGAEVGGIVGVAIEELIRQEGSLEDACKVIVNKDQEEIWLQDPVLEKPRDLMASISGKRYSHLQEACENYIRTNEIDYKVYDFHDFRKDYDDHDIVECEREFDKSVDYHTGMSICKKAGRMIKQKAKDVKTSCEAYVGNDGIGVAYRAEPKKLPDKREECIPKDMDEAVQAFRKEHPDVDMYEKGKNVCAMVDRKITEPHRKMGEKIDELMEERGYSCGF